jgi:RNA polymerase sigma factor (sigma-70 family)
VKAISEKLSKMPLNLAVYKLVLHPAINELPEKQKTAFVLRQLEDLSYAEIAEVMQTTTPSVESLLFRAKQNLQKILKN